MYTCMHNGRRKYSVQRREEVIRDCQEETRRTESATKRRNAGETADAIQWQFDSLGREVATAEAMRVSLKCPVSTNFIYL